MGIQDLFNAVVAFAKECGMEQKTPTINGNTIIRDYATSRNISQDDFLKGAYFGFIRKEEEYSGGYHDYSLVFFPQIDAKACVVALGVGTLGFANDYDIASLPWIRRLFTRLRNEGARTFFKNDFSDIENASSDLLSEIKENYPQLKKVIDTYKKVLPAAQIIDFSDEAKDNENLSIINHWIATYALVRDWANKTQMKTVEKFLPSDNKRNISSESIYHLMDSDNYKYVVLQGAPGTGKTYTALEIAEHFDKVYLEQFHAETSYSDFIYGIRPKLDSNDLAYESQEGVLYKAIDYANKHQKEKVLLIIDEINRANLSNVLGPVFYLFEKNDSTHSVPLVIGDMELTTLPKNLYVIATMNTADRSLAVVDFALRRRFTWLTLKPHAIHDSTFQNRCFSEFDSLFQKYASDDELNLQPGQSYFLAKDDSEMKKRIEYELMPLIKEYFNEGYLLKAKDEFCNYFYNKIGVLLYE